MANRGGLSSRGIVPLITRCRGAQNKARPRSTDDISQLVNVGKRNDPTMRGGQVQRRKAAIAPAVQELAAVLSFSSFFSWLVYHYKEVHNSESCIITYYHDSAQCRLCRSSPRLRGDAGARAPRGPSSEGEGTWKELVSKFRSRQGDSAVLSGWVNRRTGTGLHVVLDV